MERYFEISNALIKSEGAAWDDHNGGSEIKLKGMAALVIGDQAIPVGLHHGDYFSLNRVYLKDGKVHLSQESVGGTLFPANFSDLWECIIDYNEKQVGNKFSCGTLENPMSLKPVPVTVITMNVEEFNAKKHLRAVAAQAGILPPDDEYVHLKLGELPIDSQRKLTSLNVDFLPGDEDEIQEAYYREMLAKKETGVVSTEDLGKEIPFVAGYAGHKDPSKP